MREAVMRTDIPGVPVKRGKVRDVYDFGDRLLIVATDRISAFDWVLPTAIPDKGRVLTEMTLFWLNELPHPSHFITTNLTDGGITLPASVDPSMFEGRSMVVQKCEAFPVECVARGHIAGSGWKDYKRTGSICGVDLPSGLVESQKLQKTIFTPATKAESGHDENISFEEMVRILGDNTRLAHTLKAICVSMYEMGADIALERGVIIADTKFEFGRTPDGRILVIDEVLTPDSSRFWPVSEYTPGMSQPSFDKQYVRDWLTDIGWDKNSNPPALPEAVVEATRDKYLEAYYMLTEKALPWDDDADVYT